MCRYVLVLEVETGISGKGGQIQKKKGKVNSKQEDRARVTYST